MINNFLEDILIADPQRRLKRVYLSGALNIPTRAALFKGLNRDGDPLPPLGTVASGLQVLREIEKLWHHPLIYNATVPTLIAST